MTATISVNRHTYSVDVDGDTPLLGCCAMS